MGRRGRARFNGFPIFYLEEIRFRNFTMSLSFERSKSFSSDLKFRLEIDLSLPPPFLTAARREIRA